jgi:hypothetical protein
MIGAVPPGHPKQTLLFFKVSDLDQTIRTEMRNLVYGLADVTRWTLGPPSFVDDREEPQARRATCRSKPSEAICRSIRPYRGGP